MFRRRPILTAFVVAGLAWAGLAWGALAAESGMHRTIGAASPHQGPLDPAAGFAAGAAIAGERVATGR